VRRLAAVLVGGSPATGKSTLAAALAPRLDAALLDLDVATGPLTRVVSSLAGVPDLDDPVLAGLTTGRPARRLAPFSAERAQPSAWAATARRIDADLVMVWLHLPPEELIRRLTRRALARDENKIRDPASFLTGLDLAPPAVPHLALDAREPTAVLVRAVLDHLGR
jgi:hypothetical protein